MRTFLYTTALAFLLMPFMFGAFSSALPTGTDTGLAPGQYQAGTDLPAGQYVVINETSFDKNVITVTAEPAGEQAEPQSISFTSRQFLTLNEGEYINFKNGKLYSLNTVTDTPPATDTQPTAPEAPAVPETQPEADTSTAEQPAENTDNSQLPANNA